MTPPTAQAQDIDNTTATAQLLSQLGYLREEVTAESVSASVPSLHSAGFDSDTDGDGSLAGEQETENKEVDGQDEREAVQVQCVVRTRIPSEFGNATHSLLMYTNSEDDKEHLALVFGYAISGPGAIYSRTLEAVRENETSRDRAIRGATPLSTSTVPITAPELNFPTSNKDTAPLARIHSCCFTGETLGSLRCDCREQLVEAMKCMSVEGRGVVLYLIQEGRGIGLKEKLRAYNLIDQGYDTREANIQLGHPADARSYRIAAAILRDLNIPSVRLLTNNPHKINSMISDGVVVSERIPMIPASWTTGILPGLEDEGANAIGSKLQDRDGYLVAKVKKMGHILDIPSEILAGTSVARF
ncbi:GTP cyclohydrolase II [Physocladia obscura]|uniref:GTP cyclohydrolase II n=1 Tax=Physocladia obscura TaxID=109957 RepID=A0AAD5SQF6_9FUNG|nr:GTP cyclohydrolase II [Physocladia obscura]